MTAAMEQRYRRALRWYPRKWREEQGDVVISTLLDVAAGEDRTTTRLPELLNLAATGIATRIGGVVPTGTRDRISTVALGSGAVLAVVFLIVHTWSPWADLSIDLGGAFPTLGPFANPGVFLYGIWVVGLVFGMLAWHRALQYTMIAAVIVPLILRLVNHLQGDTWPGPATTTLGFFLMLALCVLAGTPARPSRIAVIAAVTLAASYIVYAVNGVPEAHYVDDRYFWSGMAWSYGVVLMIFVGLMAAIFLGIARQRELALLVLGALVPWAIIAYAGAFRSDAWNTLGVTCLVIVAAGIALAGRLAIRRSRQGPLPENAKMNARPGATAWNSTN